MPLLEINDVSVSFGDTEVLSGISLELESKQLLAVLGASGAGKSTLMRLIAGFDSVGGGSIVLDGEILSDSLRTVAPERRSIGIVPQDSALFPHLNVSQNIGFGLSGLSKEAKAERVGELLRLIRMEEFASRMPQELSGGQVQRVALARALAPRPKLVLLDEPFSALDAELRGQLREEVRQVLRAEGATAVLVTHDQEEALSLADRVAVLREGKIIQVGSPSEIYNSPADVGIATFLGESVLVDGKVSGGKILTDLGSLSALNNVAEGATGVVAIRSENFYLQPNPTGDSEVVGRVFFG
ncbi:MAG: ABC transporter ATP-binding protein, partial [Actinobacteria bacterium]|nr:ABC transporter ATP-binding protein [Actinomycetota bacterium]